MDANAINKVCKLNFRYFTMYLTISQQQGYQSFFKYGVYFFETLIYLFLTAKLVKE